MKTPSLNILMSAAKLGGCLAVESLPQATRVVDKGFGDFATEADLLSQQAIISELRKECPDVAIIAEEDEHKEAVLQQSFFTVDPFDGTIIASRGYSEWGVLLSYIENGIAQLAVLYQPVLNRMITAERGKGCYLHTTDSEPLQLVFLESEQEKIPSSVILGYEVIFATEQRHIEASLMRLVKAKKILITRCCGAMIEGGFQLLLGQTDLYVNMIGGKIWDFAPLVLAVTEAGGVCSGVDAESLQFKEMTFDKIQMGGAFARSRKVLELLKELRE